MTPIVIIFFFTLFLHRLLQALVVNPNVHPQTFDRRAFFDGNVSTHFLNAYLRHCATGEEPTDDEWARGAHSLVHPPLSYGTQFRREGAVRLVALGGSNTAQREGLVCTESPAPRGERLYVSDVGYVQFLDAFLKAQVSSDSYAMNEGRAGRGPRDYVGNVLAFEGLPLAQWPNVLLLEFAVNCQEKADWTTARDLDALVRSMRRKWSDRGLASPEFLFFELFTVEWLVNRAAALPEDRLAQINNISLHLEWSPTGSIGFDRGVSGSLQITTFARFYAIPLLSWADVAFPSWLRHWVGPGYVNSTNQLWALCATDGTHLSLRGQELAATRLLGGFFLDQLRSRNGEAPRRRRSNDSHIYDVDLHLFASTPEEFTVARFTSWGLQPNTTTAPVRQQHNTVNTLAPTVLRPPTSPSFQFMHAPHRRQHVDTGHTCLGSSEPGAEAHFAVPVACTAPCKVLVSTLHSWNSEYVGNVACGLVHAVTRAVIANVTIAGAVDGTGSRMKQWTVPMSTVVKTDVSPGNYTLQCVKLDHLFVCIDTLTVVETRLASFFPAPAVPPPTTKSQGGGGWQFLRGW